MSSATRRTDPDEDRIAHPRRYGLCESCFQPLETPAGLPDLIEIFGRAICTRCQKRLAQMDTER